MYPCISLVCIVVVVVCVVFLCCFNFVATILAQWWHCSGSELPFNGIIQGIYLIILCPWSVATLEIILCVLEKVDPHHRA